MNKVKDIITLKKAKQGIITINNDLNKYEHMPVASKKLQEATEFLAKYGIPEEWANEAAKKGEKHNFWTSGILIYADAKENAFSIAVKTPNTLSENTYIISTTAEILNTLVKNHWGEQIKVFLRPKAIIGQPFHYDLIEVK